MKQTDPFQPPSKKWMFVLGPFSIFSIGWTLKYIFLFYAGPPSITLKWKLATGMLFMFCSLYLIAGYRYLQWSAPKKNMLYHLIQKYPNLIVEKYNRLILSTQQLIRCNINPAIFKGLQQRDLREVIDQYHKKTQ